MSDRLLPALHGAHGDHPQAITVAGESSSWSALHERAAATASSIAGMRAVAVEATPTLSTVTAVAAGLVAGVAVVPVAPDAGPVERAHVVRDSGAEAVLGPCSWSDVDLPRLPLRSLPVGALVEPPLTSTALVMYTSGTTGAPKGVVLSRSAIAADLDGLAAAWAWTADDLLVHGLPLFHVHGLVLGVLGALRTGSRLLHTGRPTPDAYARGAQGGGSLFFGVPTVWGRVAADPSAGALRSARLLVSGSAPLPVSVFERLHHETGHSPVERYGMTETLITLSTRDDGERRPGWVGVPINGVATRLVGDDGRTALHDGSAIGELHISGPTLFDGYLGRADATTACFDGAWFRTGDAAVIDDGGFHRIVGRMSLDVIKTGGFKVGAGEVEAALLAHPSVEEVAVVGLADDDLGERIVAFVVGDGADAATLVQWVADTLSVHKRPREVRIVASLPRNAMGKVQKQQLR